MFYYKYNHTAATEIGKCFNYIAAKAINNTHLLTTSTILYTYIHIDNDRVAVEISMLVLRFKRK